MASRKSLRNRAEPCCERLDERALPSVYGFRAALAARMAASHGSTAQQALTATHPPAVGTVVHSLAPTFTATHFVPNTFSAATPVAPVTVQGNPSIVSGRFVSNITVTRPVTIAVSKPVPTTPTPIGGAPVSDPMTRLGSVLGALYQQQTTGQPIPTTVALTLPYLEIQGNSIHVNIRPSGDVGSMITAAESAGMTIEAVDPTTGTAEGVIAIDQLLTLASQPEIIAITPVIKPILLGSGNWLAR